MRDTPPNQYRFKKLGHLYSSFDSDGMNGAFFIPYKNGGHKIFLRCIVSDGTCPESIKLDPNIAGWEHVSVSALEYGRSDKERTPTWAEMCFAKEQFWKDDEWVIQYHPSKDKYVNIHDHVLHLWKPPVDIPKPPIICV